MGVYNIRLEDDDSPEVLEITTDRIIRRVPRMDDVEFVQVIALNSVRDRGTIRHRYSRRRPPTGSS